MHAGLPFSEKYESAGRKQECTGAFRDCEDGWKTIYRQRRDDVKGARKAKEAGADAIIVSNHGGRVLDQCPATAEVLEEIVKEVNGSMKILVDGRIRSGTDVSRHLPPKC